MTERYKPTSDKSYGNEEVTGEQVAVNESVSQQRYGNSF